MKLLKHRTLEEDLHLLIDRSQAVESVSIGEIFQTLSGKGRTMILIFLCLPFCQPIQIPGSSIPFGLAIAIIGLRMAFSKTMWMPKKITDQMIPSHIVKTIAEKSLSFMKKMKKITHPRWNWLCDWTILQISHGLLLFFMGILLALPIPIPLSNMAAGWSILLVSIGLLEDDGLFVLLGYLVAILSTAAFIFIVLSMRKVF